MSQWKPTASRFVAFLDIMGFKDRVFRNDHQSVLEDLEKFEPAIGAIEQSARENLRVDRPSTLREAIAGDYGGAPIVRPVFFSDSILMVSNSDTLGSARLLLKNVISVMTLGLRLGIPLKGAIAHGMQTDNFRLSLHFGRPLIDAYELQNEVLLYGIAVHHSMESHLAEKGMIAKFEGSLIHRYPTPQKKSGPVNHYLVADPQQLLQDQSDNTAVSKLYNSVSGSARIYVDNTAKFFDWLGKPK